MPPVPVAAVGVVAQTDSKADASSAACSPPAFSLLRVRGLAQEHSRCASEALTACDLKFPQ